MNTPHNQSRFVFVIPLRNPAVAQDWDRCVALGADTLRSALNQTAPQDRFRVILVCQDFPEGIVEHPCLDIIRHPFPDPAKNWGDQHEDKYLKIRHGLVRARDYAPCYVMKLDADDLVSNRLVEFVLNDDNRRGYYLELGYRWRDGSKYLEPTKKFYKGCGSSNALYANTTQLPPSIEDDSRDYDLVALGHNITVETFTNRGTPLGLVPFPAAIYRMESGENITSQLSPETSNSFQKPNWKFHVGHILKKTIARCRRRQITSQISDEFQITDDNSSGSR